jgi:DNA-binding CsgD family transcriptional regulator
MTTSTWLVGLRPAAPTAGPGEITWRHARLPGCHRKPAEFPRSERAGRGPADRGSGRPRRGCGSGNRAYGGPCAEGAAAVDRPALSAQETRTLQLYATGLPVKSVARRLGIGEETAKQFVRRVRESTPRPTVQRPPRWICTTGRSRTGISRHRPPKGPVASSRRGRASPFTAPARNPPSEQGLQETPVLGHSISRKPECAVPSRHDPIAGVTARNAARV